MIRLSTLNEAFGFWQDANLAINPQKRGDAATRFIWTVASGIGAVVYFASFGAFALPFFDPTFSWLGSCLTFCILQFTALFLTNINSFWSRSASRLWLLWNTLRGKDTQKIYEEARAAQPAVFK